MRKPGKSAIDEFIALPDAEKDRIVAEIEAESPQQRLARSRPLNARERAQWRRFKAKMGRPKMGKGAKTISLTVEKGLLEQADAYAKKQGVSRASLVAQGLRAVMGSPSRPGTRNSGGFGEAALPLPRTMGTPHSRSSDI